MNVRRLDSQNPVSPAATPATERPQAPAAQKAQTAAPQSEFAQTADASQGAKLGSAIPQAHLPQTMSLGTEPTTGPVDLGSIVGKAATQTTLDYLEQTLSAAGSAAQEFRPKSVEVDELGMTHVRMDRVHNGLPVLGEQVISHIRDGKVVKLTGDAQAIPAELGKGSTKLSAKEAKEIAQKSFDRAVEGEPTIRKVIAQDADGSYKVAYQVEMENFSAGPLPVRMNYLVDAQSGKVMESWNQFSGIALSKEKAAKILDQRVAPTAEAKAEPNLDILDNSTVTSKVTIDQDFPAEQVTLDLNLKHTYRGDLVVTLTSPSGKSVTVSDKEGGGDDDIVGPFDLSDFAGESAKGEWTLTVQDTASQDTGKLVSWGVKVTGKDPNPPPPPPPAVDDQTAYSGKVQIDATQKPDGTWVLNDKSRGRGVETRDAQNKGSYSGAKEITDANNLWGEATDNPRAQAGVDAQYGGQMTYDFYKEIFGRDSIDGKGEKLISNVHINTNYVNAYWDGKQMSYGDGDGQDASALTTLDIAGHEISHGLTERTAGLIYRGESGGLNEAISDIFGTGVEWLAAQKNPAVKFDYTLGEDCWTPNDNDPADGLRYMDDPTKDGYSIDNYKDYPKQTEVHGSSGIANNAFYLMAEGGTNRTSGIKVESGIGTEKALKIFGRALIHYMTPSTTFAQAREACINAATDLYGADSAEVATVKQAWTAVGVN